MNTQIVCHTFIPAKNFSLALEEGPGGPFG